MQAQIIFFNFRVQIPVFQLDATTFEAVENDGAGGAQMWCAAAIFTRRVLGRDTGGIYVKVARGPAQSMPGRRSVVFTIEPIPDAFTTYDTTIRRTGKVMSFAAANAQCRSDREVVVRLSNGAWVYW